MTAIEIEMKQKELLREISNDEGLLESALNYVKRKKRELMRFKCQFTMEELESELQKSEEDIKSGRVYTQEQMKSLNVPSK